MVWGWLNSKAFAKDHDIQVGSSLHTPLSTCKGLTSPQQRTSSVGVIHESLDVATTAITPMSKVASATLVHFEHKVQEGEWLYNISRRHNVDLRTLLKANPSLKDPDNLVAGSIIKIPHVTGISQYTSHKRNQLQNQGSLSTELAMSIHREMETLRLSKVFLLSNLVISKTRKHRVIEGDSLEGIAEKYGTTVSSLKKLNNLDDDVIYTGSVLEVEDRGLREKHQILIGERATLHERNAILEHGPVNTQLVLGPSVETPYFCLYPLFQTAEGITPSPPEPITVKVRSGDTLANISYQHGLSIHELQQLNNLKDDAIAEGDVLVLYTGPEKKEVLELRHGRRRTHRHLFSRQFLSNGSSLGVGGPEIWGNVKSVTDGLKLEGKWKLNKKGLPQRDKLVRFSAPLKEGFLSSPFGWRWGAFHEGVDLAAEQGTPIYASDKGTVTFAGWNGGYGYLVAIQHEGGFVTRYGHCCAIHARVGQQVLKGQQVAAVGCTGRATGPHLHFEVRKNGEALDPFKWLPL